MDSKISILIATKDRQSMLASALQSVAHQSKLPYELIIVNDGSSDSTKEYLDEFKLNHPHINTIVINRSSNGGVNTARNQGIKISSSDWIFFLDDDDRLVPDAIEVISYCTNEIPSSYGVFYLNTKIQNDNDTFIGGFQFENENITYYDPTYAEVMAKFGLKGDCKPVFRRKLFENDKYYFPETVNGFESFTIKMMAKDGIGMRYYKSISTLVDLRGTFEHLSFSAPAKNPRNYMNIHIQDLSYHVDFYASNKNLLRNKYWDIVKLALRAHDVYAFIKYGIKFLVV